MSSVVKTPFLNSGEALQRLRRAVHPRARNFFAMYSSLLEGIVKDPALMVLPLDDHMVHRGHGVFDTAALIHGRLYQLDEHLERMRDSAKAAHIPLPMDPADLRDIVLATSAASGQRDASVRYWLSAGPGGFSLDPGECVGSAFYVIVFKQENCPDSFYENGITVVTSGVPIKAPFFARVKSTNYLPNVLVVIEAKEKGAHNGIFVDQRGMVGEGSNMNVGFVTRDGIFRHPPFDSILSGITVRRVAALARRLVEKGDLKDVVFADIPLDEGRAAAEMFLIGSTTRVMPVVQWDGRPIGNGRPGPIARKLLELWLADVEDPAQSVAVPYDRAAV
jgi:4-amino-4-deoxychorismate lyase